VCPALPAASGTARGTCRGGAPLHPVTEAKRVRTRDGRQRVLDGPFAEAKEVIAGYFVIEAPDIDAAVAIAARCPNAEFGSVEVREIVPKLMTPVITRQMRREVAQLDTLKAIIERAT
jgi:hypothetical protein